MKKRLIGLAVFLLVVTALSACQKVPTPNERLSQYIKLWKSNDFKTMYQDYLAPDTKKDWKSADFVDRYPKIYKDLNVQDLKVSFKQLKADDYKKKDKVTVPMTISFKTMAGPVHYTENMVLEKKEVDKKTNWYMDWKPSFILPGLEKGDVIKPVTEEPKRGEILDRNGSGLAVNGTVSEIGLIPEQMKGHEQEVKSQLSKLLGLSVSEIDQKLNASWVQPGNFVPIKKLSPDQNKLLPNLYKLPGVDKQSAEARVYPFGKAASHLVGYIGPITAEELAKHKDDGYTASSLIGKRGLEQLYDKQLRGTTGVKIVILNSNGDQKKVVAEQKVQNGKNIKVTINGDLQKKIYAQMKDDAGTASAINPKTGEVLALVSAPAFDPNAFELGMSNEDYSKLANDPKKPLINRFALTYAPGSSMKPLTGAIALNTGTMKPSDTKTITGKEWGKGGSWGDYKITRVDVYNAPENMETAMMFSDNIWFAKTALDLGADKFIKGLKTFGFGEDIPFDYPLKNSQISSDGTLNKEVLLADSGYGQGQVEMNILHLATSYTPFIDNGNMIKPHLLVNEKTSYWKKNVINTSTAKEISGMLRTVVADPRGTGHMANLPGKEMAGKTGTAELKKTKKEKGGKENGVFVAYDQKNPNLLVSMLIEGVQTKGGSHVVVQKVSEIFK